ncbi:aminotransferase class V-fold PLP-dependent enzyme [Metabacillus sp. HB246100]
MQNIQTIRKAFPILNKKIQLSSCSQSALHMDVQTAINDYLEGWAEDGMDWEIWMDACEQARNKFATMINADKDEIAIVSSVSHAISSIATSLQPTKHRNKVLITDFDFPTVGNVWTSHRDRYEIEFIQTQEYLDKNNDIPYEDIIDDSTLLLSTTHVSFYNGYKQNLQKIAKHTHDQGALLLVDAYQSAGQTPIDVKEMEVDILTAGMQKYMLGIPGIAFMYIKRELAEALTPKITGWFGQKNPFDFDIKNNILAPSARRFDTGTFPMINGFAANAALSVFEQYNINTIEQHLQHLSSICIREVNKHELTHKSPTNLREKGSNTAIHVKNASEVESLLRKKGIIVSARNDVIRIAPHFYNTEDDVRTAVYELAQLI